DELRPGDRRRPGGQRGDHGAADRRGRLHRLLPDPPGEVLEQRRRHALMRSILLVLGLAFPAAGAPLNPDTLVVLLREPWQSLDPAVATDLGSQLIYDNVFESLVAFGKGPDDFRPWLSS